MKAWIRAVEKEAAGRQEEILALTEANAAATAAAAKEKQELERVLKELKTNQAAEVAQLEATVTESQLRGKAPEEQLEKCGSAAEKGDGDALEAELSAALDAEESEAAACAAEGESMSRGTVTTSSQ